MFRPLAPALAGLLLAASASAARDWSVLPDGTGDAPTIQAAIDSATAGDRVLIAAGTYFEHDISMESGVSLVGGAGAEATIIDAQGMGRVLSAFYLDDTTLIDGLTLTGGLAPWGGGLDAEYSSPLIRRCVFRNNAVEGSNGGLGGGAVFYGGDAVLEDCLFRENSAYNAGGGIYIGEETTTHVTRCLFLDNVAYNGGGALCEVYSTPVFTSCTFWGNTITNSMYSVNGAGVACQAWSVATIENCLVAGNHGGWGVGTYCVSPPTAPGLNCTDIWGNDGGDWMGCAPLESQLDVDGNFNADPMLCDPEGGDFTLRSGSPCAPPGVTGCGLVGALPVGCGPVGIEERSWGRLKSAYR